MEWYHKFAEGQFKDASAGVLLTTILGDPMLAYRVEKILANSPRLPKKNELMRINGVGEATALKILACCELSARYFVGTEATSISTPEQLAVRFCSLRFEPQEHFCMASLDTSNNIIDVHEVTVGLVNQVPVHPREVFRYAVLDNATSIAVAHNHPSGSTEPSDEDIAMTRCLVAAGNIMRIPVIDHLIVSRTGTASMLRQMPELFEMIHTRRR